MASPNPASVYGKVQLTYDAKLNAILERAARDIQGRIAQLKVGIGGDVRKAQLNLVLNEIRNIQQAMWVTSIGPTIQRGKQASAKAAEDATEALERVLYTALPQSVADAVRGGLRATAMAGIERDHARIPRDLSARVYHDFALTSGEVERVIRSGLIQGLSARELASDVYRFISPTTPGGASYAASRLARTEINNAFHEQQKAGGQRPGVKAVIWNLSGSHGKPDQCNVYASQDTDGLGRGKYKPGNVPSKPHPQCLCYMTYDTMSPDEFAKAIERGKFDNELTSRIRANLDRLGPAKITPVKTPKPPAKKPAASKVTPIKKVPAVKKTAPPVKKAAPVAKKAATTPRGNATLRNPLFKGIPKLQDRGLFGRTADMDFDILNANPKYRRVPNYDINCVHVVNAYELRARGLQVTASKLPDSLVPNRGRNAQDALNRWVLPDGSPHHRSIHGRDTFADISRETAAWPDGARGWMRVSWRSGGGHIINVEKINGFVRYVDAQSGLLDINQAQYIGNVTSDGWSIVRVDDLEPSIHAPQTVMEFIDPAIR